MIHEIILSIQHYETKEYKTVYTRSRVRDTLQRVSLRTPSCSSEEEFELLPIPWNTDGLTIQVTEMKGVRPCYFSDQVRTQP